jgi:hypothetical protein
MAPLARPAATTFTDTPSGKPEKQRAVMESLIATVPIGTALMECNRNILLPSVALLTVAMSPRVSLTDTRFTGTVMLLPEMQRMYDKLQNTAHYYHC